MKSCLLVFSLLMAATPALVAEEHAYVPDPDPLVRARLQQWQDLKFGLLMHWGPYSQWGIVESWSLCPEDQPWCERRAGTAPGDYFAYKREYENLKTTFDPVAFDPARWAAAAAAAGMKYVVFTTKHHDGFCMFDSQLTDYKITSEDCPFHTHPQADVTRAIFDAFRQAGLWTGAYFSKPDWHSPHYWHPGWPPLDRNVNYDPALYPDTWERFVQFTHGQIMELLTGYGPVDILWLDGGWVARKDPADIRRWYQTRIDASSSGFLKSRIVDQDIRMDELVATARAAQPGLIVVDRAVPGVHQNYLTPENRVPTEALPYPWESCIIAGESWSWVPDAQYRSVAETVHLLVDIVAKGGNLLLNVAPGPDGAWHDEAYTLLRGMGDWLAVNGEAIYGTRAISPYKSGRVCLTRSREARYAIVLGAPEEAAPPPVVTIEGLDLEAGARISMLGDAGLLAWEQDSTGLKIFIPDRLRSAPPCAHAWSLKIE